VAYAIARYMGLSILAVLLLLLFVLASSPFFVAYKATKIAGDRPYCIMVTNKSDRSNDLYDTVSRRSQLAFYNLTARLEHNWGSGRAFVYTTNYALLVLDRPREYRNWSFSALDFVNDALINVTHGHDVHGKTISIMKFELCAPKPDFVASLKWR
jgi:hypothetical protein